MKSGNTPIVKIISLNELKSIIKSVIKEEKSITNGKKVYNSEEIKDVAYRYGYKVKTVILGGIFNGKEYLAVTLKFGVTAFFIMNEETFDYTYSYTYNAMTDKTSKKLPKGF